jgi:hypothetical protein
MAMACFFSGFPELAASFTVSPSSNRRERFSSESLKHFMKVGNNLTILVNGAKLTRTSIPFESTDFPL